MRSIQRTSGWRRYLVAAGALALLALTSWGAPPQVRITPPDAAAEDVFGWSVAAEDDLAVFGVPGDNGTGDQDGSAQVWVRRYDGWHRVATLRAEVSGASDNLGWDVAVHGGVVLVGANGDPHAGTGTGAAYVFGRDAAGAWVQQARLTASDAEVGDDFGARVAIHGSTAVVGAKGEDEFGGAAGAVYVYTRDADGVWSEHQKLMASDGAEGDSFGSSVALYDGTLVVGASHSDDTELNSGSLYVFTRDSGGDWTEHGEIHADVPEPNHHFGGSVALTTDGLVVGADGDAHVGVSAGAAYVFRPGATAGDWDLDAKLVASDAVDHARFGNDVAIRGDRVLVGAPGDDDAGSSTGAAYLFIRRGPGDWVQRYKLKAWDPVQVAFYGQSVALGDGTALASAPLRAVHGAASGAVYASALQHKLTVADPLAQHGVGEVADVDRDTLVIGAARDDHAGDRSGAAYVFVRAADRGWTQHAKLTASDATAGAEFGNGVAISGDTIVVGADLADGAGRAYVFDRDDAGNWTESAQLEPADAKTGDHVGEHVAIDGDTVVVSAHFHDGAFDGTGAAYVFTRGSDGAWTERTKLTDPAAQEFEFFGSGVAVENDTIAVFMLNDVSPNGTGSVHVFVPDGSGGWMHEEALTPSDADTFSFGAGLALDGGRLLISGRHADNEARAYVYSRDLGGAWIERDVLAPVGGVIGHADCVALEGDTAVLGVSRDALFAGAAFVFVRDATGDWVHHSRLTAFDTHGNHFLGMSVVMTDGDVVAGALGDDDHGHRSGAYYVFPGVGGGPPLALLTPPLAESTEGVAARFARDADGGLQPYTWRHVGGIFPVDGGFDRFAGFVEGPLATSADYAYTIRLRDASGATVERSYTTRVNALPVVTAVKLPPAVVGRPYETSLGATGGTGLLSMEVASGILADGLTLDADGGITGKPTAAGRFKFAVRCTDAVGASGNDTPLSLLVAPIAEVTTRKLRETLTFGSGGDAEEILRALELIAGTQVTISLRFPDKGEPPVAVTITAPDGTELDVSGATRVKKKGRILQLKKVVVPADGRYLLRFTPEPVYAADVRLDVKITAPTKFQGEGMIGGTKPLEASFAALEGAVIKIVVKRPRGSPAVPTITTFTDAEGQDRPALVGAVKERAKNAVLRIKEPLPAGTMSIGIDLRGGAPGDVTWKVTIKQPKAYEFSLPDLPSAQGSTTTR